jgi:cytochrome P450
MDTYGSVSRMRLGPYWLYAIAEPEMIEEILVGKPEKFRKDVGTKDVSVFLGQGLLVSDGEVWRKQRKLVAPSLQRRQIEAYAETMVDEAERMVGAWEDGETLDFHLEVTSMTLRIVVKALFGLEMDEAIEAISSASDDVMEYIEEMRHSPWRFVPDPIPSPKQRDFERAKQRLDDIVYGLIEERRAGEAGDDLLYRLLQATGRDGGGMSDEQLRDEVLTLFMAGHETTSLSITYAWYMLSQYPERAQRLREEARRVFGGERPGLEHVEELEYAEAVFKESMRLYPPAWALGREPIEDVEIGGVTIPKGAQVMLPQFRVHRDERWYDDPDAFRPERWMAGEGEEEAPAEDRPRMAYFPFGGGPRICVGNHFARMEAVLAMAIIAREWSVELVGPEELETYTSITQRPTETVEMRVRGG